MASRVTDLAAFYFEDEGAFIGGYDNEICFAHLLVDMICDANGVEDDPVVCAFDRCEGLEELAFGLAYCLCINCGGDHGWHGWLL